MAELRGGIQVGDPRLDALVEFDERSRAFAAIDEEKKTTLDFVVKSWKLFKTLDQGQEGACVGFGVGHWYMAEPDPHPRLTATGARKLYRGAQYLDSFSDTPPGEGTSVIAGLKQATKQGWIKGYRWTFSRDELALAVGHEGGAVLGLTWHAGMMRPNAAAWIRPTGQVVGRHCIFCYAVEPFKWFELQNSWGPTWGANGRCRIAWDDMATLLGEQGESAIPVPARS